MNVMDVICAFAFFIFAGCVVLLLWFANLLRYADGLGSGAVSSLGASSNECIAMIPSLAFSNSVMATFKTGQGRDIDRERERDRETDRERDTERET